MTGILQNIREDQIHGCPQNIVALYDEVQKNLRQLVGDTAQHFAQRAKQQSPRAQ
jgi:hypothetical protein